MNSSECLLEINWPHFKMYIVLLCVVINIYHHRQRDNLEDMLRDLTPERIKIAKCMVFCVKNADCAEEVCTQSFSIASIWMVTTEDFIHQLKMKFLKAKLLYLSWFINTYKGFTVFKFFTFELQLYE